MNEKLPKIEVIYDKACPFCNRFAGVLKQSGNVIAIDARTNPDRLHEAEKSGLNIDRGFVVYARRKFYGENFITAQRRCSLLQTTHKSTASPVLLIGTY